jgi:predicted TIM-barrel fold metal-dependent hydrolase
MMDKVLIVSSDCHGGIPTQDYRPYLEKRYHEQLDDYDRWTREAHLGPDYYEKPGAFPDNLVAERDEVSGRTRFTDPQGRLLDLEENGVVSEVIFPAAAPGVQPPWSDFLSGGRFRVRTPAARELQAAGEKAYNRWLAEFCQAVPKDRRLGLALLPLHDPAAAVAEAEWAAEAGLRGVVMPFFSYDLPEMVNPYWEPIWDVLEQTNLTMNFHGGNGAPEFGEYQFLWLLEFQHWARRVLSQTIFSGVFDRHPNLHATITEARASWIPDALAQLDAYMEQANGPVSANTALTAAGGGLLPQRLPSEYWTTNWSAGSSITNVEELRRRYDIGLTTMCYGIDYPHPEGAWGRSGPQLVAASFAEAGVSADEARLMLGLNAARLYNLDLVALQPVVDRVGPTIDEVMAGVSAEAVEQVFEEARKTGRGIMAAHYRRDRDSDLSTR